MNRLAHPPEKADTILTEPKEWMILFTDEEDLISPETAKIGFDVEVNTETRTTRIMVHEVPKHIMDRWFDYQEQIEEEIRVDYGQLVQIRF